MIEAAEGAAWLHFGVYPNAATKRILNCVRVTTLALIDLTALGTDRANIVDILAASHDLMARGLQSSSSASRGNHFVGWLCTLDLGSLRFSVIVVRALTLKHLMNRLLAKCCALIDKVRCLLVLI